MKTWNNLEVKYHKECSQKCYDTNPHCDDCPKDIRWLTTGEIFKVWGIIFLAGAAFCAILYFLFV